MKWRVLAWDDHPDNYINQLRSKMEEGGSFEVTLEEKIFDCLMKFNEAPDIWDFLILDVMDDVTHPEQIDETAGVKLAIRMREKRPDIPIVFLTNDINPIFKERNNFVKPILIRPKSYPVHFMWDDILDFMRNYQSQFDKVFIIYGSNRKAGNILGEVQRAIEGQGLRCEVLSPEIVMQSISEGLVNTMKECGAFIAICTPDDEIVGDANYFQPRQNVLLEIGMATGLTRGLNRLVTIQRWGNNIEEQARLPSDLGGVLPIRFYDDKNHQDTIDQMLKALKERGVRRRVKEQEDLEIE